MAKCGCPLSDEWQNVDAPPPPMNGKMWVPPLWWMAKSGCPPSDEWQNQGDSFQTNGKIGVPPLWRMSKTGCPLSDECQNLGAPLWWMAKSECPLSKEWQNLGAPSLDEWQNLGAPSLTNGKIRVTSPKASTPTIVKFWEWSLFVILNREFKVVKVMN